MSDLLSYKNYTRFIVDYLVSLFDQHAEKASNNSILNCDQFFKIMERIYGAQYGGSINKELQQTLAKQFNNVKVY